MRIWYLAAAPHPQPPPLAGGGVVEKSAPSLAGGAASVASGEGRHALDLQLRQRKAPPHPTLSPHFVGGEERFLNEALR
jgi:hypothetical protein